jgi:hypothetical protein
MCRKKRLGCERRSPGAFVETTENTNKRNPHASVPASLPKPTFPRADSGRFHSDEGVFPAIEKVRKQIAWSACPLRKHESPTSVSHSDICGAIAAEC